MISWFKIEILVFFLWKKVCAEFPNVLNLSINAVPMRSTHVEVPTDTLQHARCIYYAENDSVTIVQIYTMLVFVFFNSLIDITLLFFFFF